jgi:hypothetical protein
MTLFPVGINFKFLETMTGTRCSLSIPSHDAFAFDFGHGITLMDATKLLLKWNLLSPALSPSVGVLLRKPNDSAPNRPIESIRLKKPPANAELSAWMISKIRFSEFLEEKSWHHSIKTLKAQLPRSKLVFKSSAI